MASFNPGDVFIYQLDVVSPRTGTWNAKINFLSCSILETIFTPGVQAEIEIIDFDDHVGKMKIAGDELVTFSFAKPKGLTATYNLHLNNIKEVEIQGAMKSKVYKMACVSRETLSGQANPIQKAYNTQISDIVKDVFKEVGSKLSVDAEETKGKRNIKISNQPAYHAIDMLRKEAVSQENQSSNFMFWATWKSFYFKTLEGMLKQGPVKNFKQDMTVGHSIMSEVDNNILAWKVNQNMDAMNRIKSGVMNQRVATFNVHTNEYQKQDFKKIAAVAAAGAGLITTLDSFINLFPKANRTVMRMVHANKELDIDKSHVPETIPHKMVNLAQMQEQMLHLTVLGDPVLEAGKMISCKVPKITSQTGIAGDEPQVSGKWLISKVEHSIRRPDVRPRHVCQLECLKGAYEEKV